MNDTKDHQIRDIGKLLSAYAELIKDVYDKAKAGRVGTTVTRQRHASPYLT